MRLLLVLSLALASFAAGCLGSEPGTGPDGGADAPGDGNMTKAMPAATHFEFGPSSGCAGDAIAMAEDVAQQGLNCASFMQGLDGTGIDGHWVALNESYWGLELTSTVMQSPAGPVGVPVVGGSVLGDTDCVLTDASFRIIADGSAGSAPCTIVVPQDAAYLFIYPYATPATELTVDFAAVKA